MFFFAAGDLRTTAGAGLGSHLDRLLKNCLNYQGFDPAKWATTRLVLGKHPGAHAVRAAYQSNLGIALDPGGGTDPRRIRRHALAEKRAPDGDELKPSTGVAAIARRVLTGASPGPPPHPACCGRSGTM